MLTFFLLHDFATSYYIASLPKNSVLSSRLSKMRKMMSHCGPPFPSRYFWLKVARVHQNPTTGKLHTLMTAFSIAMG